MSKLRHCNTMDPMVRQAEVTPQRFRHLHIYWRPIMRHSVICLYDLHHPSNFFLPISQPSAGKPDTQPPIAASHYLSSAQSSNQTPAPHLTSQQLNHHHSTNHTTQSDLTLLRRQNPPAIPSFPPPSRRPQQIQPFHQSSAGVSLNIHFHFLYLTK